MKAPAGLALIVVVGVLGLLAVLGVAFVTMAQLERKASEQRVHASKAALLARAGLEHALAALDRGQDPAYGGEDWNGNGALDGLEISAQAYVHGRLNRDGCPVEQALRPSLYVRDPLSASTPKDPLLAPVDGRNRGLSGRLAGDRAAQGNQYALRIQPESGIWINGGDPSAPATYGYNATLRRLLGTLAEAVDREDGADDGLPADQADGERLVDLRPASGWADYDQVRALALAGSPARLDALRGYLSLHPWVDRRVIAPNATASMKDAQFRAWADIKLGCDVFGDNVPTRGPPDFERGRGEDLDSDGVLDAGEDANGNGRLDRPIVGRSPVNLAWAKTRRPVLIALLAGLKGLYPNEEYSQSYAGMYGRSGADSKCVMHEAEIANAWSAADDCHRIADQIMTTTSQLDTWSQWDAFCDSLTVSSDIGSVGGWYPTIATVVSNMRILAQQARKDILKANFNPNSGLNKFGPNASSWKSVDKMDLRVYSTEFSLAPLHPYALSAVGRVLDRRGRLLASRTLRAAFAPGVLRISTQKELLCENLGNHDLPGDESDFRLPSRCFTQSQGMGKTWGYMLPSLSPQGASLQSYPEPVVDPGTGLMIAPADFDGSLQLATVETPTNAAYTVTATTQDMKLLARFDDGFDLDVADATNGRPHQPDVRQVTYVPGEAPDLSELSFSVLDPSRPNTLYPDGCYSERDRTPGFLSKGNAHGYHGVMSFWFKRNYNYTYQVYSGGRRGCRYVKWTNFVDPLPPGTGNTANQFFGIVESAHTNIPSGPGICFHFETGHNPFDKLPFRERQFYIHNGSHYVPNPNPIRLWQLMTASWDFRCKDSSGPPYGGGNGRGALVVNDGSVWKTSGDNYYAGVPDAADTAASDITTDDIQADGTWGSHLLFLGNRGRLGEQDVKYYCGMGADCTFDEFAIWDFGGAEPIGATTDVTVAEPATLSAPNTLASSRYQEGRYYKGWKYNPNRVVAAPSAIADEAPCWFSPLIQLPAGSLLRRVYWTWRVPSGTRAAPPAGLATDYAEVALVTPAKAQYVWGASQSRSPASSAATQSWEVGRAPPGPFRAQVLFLRPAALLLSIPILESPVFDDLTLVYTGPGGMRVLSWGS